MMALYDNYNHNTFLCCCISHVLLTGQPGHGFPPQQQGYYPLHTGNGGGGVNGGVPPFSQANSTISPPYSPPTNGGIQYQPFHPRDTYTPGAIYSPSPHPPPPPQGVHRSHTPTSSRSGRSHHSTSNDSSVKYNQNSEKVALPVHV